jgi:GTPase Era involved in 16S rRNA processing
MANSYPDAEQVIKETCEIFKSQGVNGLINHVTHDPNKWKQVKIKIAVTGNRGAGLSSLINALRGLQQSDQNAAKEGVIETTRERASYTIPNNDLIELYDLPGEGSCSHPIESYMQAMNFKQYDFVLIVISQGFSKNDELIIKELQRLEKPFYLVRSKIYADVENQKFTQTEDEVIKVIRSNFDLNLRRLGVKARGVFMIDSHAHNAFQLKELENALKHDAPETFKDTLILTFRTMTKEIIENKVKHLKLRAARVAFMAIVSAVPGAHYFVNEIVLKDEISLYKTELGLDDEALGKTCKDLEVDRARLQEMIAFCEFVVYPEKAIDYIKNLKENMDSSPPRYKNLPVYVLHWFNWFGEHLCKCIFRAIRYYRYLGERFT